MNHFARNTWEQFQYRHMRICFVAQLQRFLRVGVMNQMRLIRNMHARFRQCRIIIRVKCRKMFRISLRRTIRTEQPVLKVNSHFRNQCLAVLIFRRCNLYCRQQVLFRIRTQHTNRQLTTREHNRFAQVPQHKRQRRT